MPARRFELVEGSSSKFWEVDAEGTNLTVRFGRIGTNGQTQTKSFASDAKAAAERDKLIKEKTGKGYKETGATALAPVAAKPAPAVKPPAPAAASAPTAARAPAPSGSVAWTDELRRSMEAVRGVSLPPKPADPTATWKKIQARAKDLKGKWKNTIASKDHGAIFKAAFERIEEDAPPAPSDPAIEGAILAVAEYAAKWNAPSYVADGIDRLVLLAGAPFALRAALATIERWAPPGDTPKVARRESLSGWNYAKCATSPFDRARAHVVTADDATYAACLEVARAAFAATTDDVVRMAIAYIFPGEEGWADALMTRIPGGAPQLLTATKDLGVVTRAIDALNAYQTLVDATERGVACRVAAILANLGASAKVIEALFQYYDKLPGTEYKRGCASVLALVDTPEAVAGLVARAEQKEAQPSLHAAIERSPGLAVRALAEVATSRSKSADAAKQLLTTTVRAGVDGLDAILISLPDAQRKVVEALREAAVSVAVAEAGDVPDALRSPRWLAKKKRTAEVVEIAAPPYPDAFAWPKGAREALPRDTYPDHAGRNNRDATETILGWLDLPVSLKGETKEDVIAKACVATEKRRQWGSTPTGFAMLPEPFALAVLKHTPSARWSTYNALAGFGAAVVKFELRIADDVLRLASDLSVHCFELLLPYDVARAAPVVARAYAELKKLRGAAERWLRLHPAAAIAGLLPAAVGKPGKPRAHAEAALHFLASEGHRDAILDVAANAGARDAALAVLDSDPFDRLPAKLPAIPEFADASRLTPPVLKSGGALPADAVAHLVTMLAFSRVDDAYAGVDLAKETCTKASLAAFAWDLFSGWLLSGASSKEQWAMNALAHLGDDDCARKLAAKVREWPGESAHARAVLGLDVLAAMGTDVALMHLHGISQKLKFKGLQEKAGEKISVIAEARGLTEDELADRLVPDLDLDDDGTSILDFGARTFRVTFDESLKPVALDATNKRLPDLPKPGKADDAEKSKDATDRWKALKKDAKTIASQQILRFELAMCARRRWTTSVFQQFLAGHPLVRHLVRRLVWATYGADGKPSALFRTAEDGTFADAKDDAFTLADDAVIGIAHALEINKEDAAAMGQVFADYEILQPFMQLGRETYALTDVEKKSGVLTRMKGKTVPTGKVLGLESRGWRRGEPQDGGGIWWIEKRLPGGLEAHLALDPGIIVGMVAENPEQKLGELVLHEEGQWSPSPKTYAALDEIVASELLRDLASLP